MIQWQSDYNLPGNNVYILKVLPVLFFFNEKQASFCILMFLFKYSGD